MPGKTTTSRPGRALLFTRNFFKHPRMLGSVVPSSRFLVGRVLEEVDWDQAKVVVEYGPGVGTFTGELLRRMRPDAVLVALETNPDFVRELGGTLRDPRLRVVHDSATEVDAVLKRLGLGSADYIISGIPFSTLPEATREEILRKTRAALGPKGAMLVYQFSPAVLPYLERVFGRVEREFEPLNIPPAQVFRCTA